jgi:hypothetical protein
LALLRKFLKAFTGSDKSMTYLDESNNSYKEIALKLLASFHG